MRLRALFAFLVVTMFFATGSFAAQSARPASQATIQLNKTNVNGAEKPGKVIVPRNAGSSEMPWRQNFDRGIYLPTYSDGKSMCAAIMSYNFTPGENPTLKDVTTCTPARPHSVYRTDENRKAPQGPVLQMISSPK